MGVFSKHLNQKEPEGFIFVWSGPSITAKGVVKYILKRLRKREDVKRAYEKYGFIIVSTI